MRTFAKPLFFLVFVTVFSFCRATDYYLSNTGNDSQNGLTPATAWETLAHLNAQIPAMQPGDRIFLSRGDVFVGEIDLSTSGSSGSPILLDAYGSGNLPILRGSIPVSGWTLHNGNIYKATVSPTVKGVYVDGERMTKARFPNTGWLFTDVGFGSNGFEDAALNQASGYWTGTDVHIRSVDWQYETRTVQSHSGSDIIFQNGTDYGINAGWGYYFDNKLSELDVAGEWFYDDISDELYLYAPGGVNPSSLTVEAVVFDIGVQCDYNSSWQTIQNLRIESYSKQGIWLGGVCQSIIVQDCEIQDIGETGIHLDVFPGTDLRVSGNTIEDAEGRGVYLFDGENAEISNNTIRRIGLIAGYGLSEVNGGVGILCYDGTSNSLISGNRLDSTGYIGIRVDGSNNTIEYNQIHNAVLTLSDGGGFHCYGNNTTGNTIRYNWVQNVIGNVESSPNSPFAMGIYLDNYSTYITVSNNIVSGATNFGLVNNFDTHHNTFTNNLVYNNGEGGMMMDDKSNAVNTGNVVTGNTFYCVGPDQVPMRLIAEYAAPNWGTFDNNAYHNPYDCIAVETKYDYGSGFEWRRYGIDHWKNASSQDANSSASLVHWNEYEAANTLSGDLIPNPTFDSNLSNWGSWPGNTAISWANNTGLDGGAMTFNMLSNSPQTYGLAYSQNFAITSGSWYQLILSTRGVNYGNLRLSMKETVGYNTTSFTRQCALNPNNRKDVNYVFQMQTSYPQARMDFEVDFATGGFYLDNAHFYEVDVEYIDPAMRSRLFVNHSANPRTLSFQDSLFTDLDGNPSNTLALAPWSAEVLLYDGPSTQVLPIEVLYLEVDCEQNGPRLLWATGGSGNGNRISIERSTNGGEWLTVGEVDHAETGTFEWQDTQVQSGPAYYRLRLIDSDNQSRVFAPIFADCKRSAASSISAYPNPLTAGQFLQVESPKEGPLRLATLSGQVIRKWDSSQDAARSLNSDRPKAGVYLLYHAGSKPIKLMILE